MEKTEQNKIELRSGKVRNIIGQIPPFWVRTGTAVIILIHYCLRLYSLEGSVSVYRGGRRNRGEDRPFWIQGEYRKI
jgi:hypothetical protein